MSEQSPDRGEQAEQDGPLTVSDDELPDDVKPSEDNPLAQPAGDDVPDDVLKDTAGGSGGDSEDAAEGGGDASSGTRSEDGRSA
ncbi:MAG TPA: hypothetical protein VH228_13335 [Nocardioides sp.]|nr:hypothetical protein [Nocardioides sp.]